MDIWVYGWLAALDVDCIVTIKFYKSCADFFCLIKRHKGVLRVTDALDSFEKIAKMAAQVACLTEPEHTPAG